MKCSYALKKHLKTNLNTGLMHKIDDHISTCPFCQEQIEVSGKIGDLLSGQVIEDKDERFWISLSRNIRSHRERMEESWLDRISSYINSALPTKTAVLSAASVAVLFIVIAIFSISVYNNDDQLAGDVNDELDYLIQEHLMIQQSEIFDHGTFSVVSDKNNKVNKGKEPYRN
ncbi:hypothetical protein ACFL6O_06080 [candidate division KSB1 bacterium]